MATKADLIRQYHKRYPDLRPTELARKIERENPVRVSVQDVSGTLAKDARRAARKLEKSVEAG